MDIAAEHFKIVTLSGNLTAVHQEWVSQSKMPIKPPSVFRSVLDGYNSRLRSGIAA